MTLGCAGLSAHRPRHGGVQLAGLLAVLLLTTIGGCAGHTARISVDEPTAPFDGPLHVRVSGVRPGQPVTVQGSAADHQGRAWHSTATFTAARDGTVDLTSATPASGSYTVASATGLLWSMAPAGTTEFTFVPASTFTVTLTLVVDGRSVATTRLQRQVEATGVRSRMLDLARDGAYGELFEPADTTAPRPAVLLFGGSEGGLTVTDEAAALASHGYPTLALAYFGEPGLPATLTGIPLEYFATALRWLARQPGVDPARLAVAGVSRGSEAALLLGVAYPTLVHAVVGLVPSSTVFSALPDTSLPAWTRGGVAVPFTRAFPGYQTPASDHPSAVIPVEKIHGPVLLLCGQQDALWPSCQFVDDMTHRLAANGFGYPVVALAEPGAGHLVGDPLPNLPRSSTYVTSPRYGRLYIGGTQAADALGRLDAWPKLLAFLAGL
jgi:dienelactone hydrolase